MTAFDARLAEPRVTVVRASGRGMDLDLRELWAHRELLYFLVWRTIKVRYKQTVMGVSWTVLQPFLAMVVLSVFLGRLARVPSDGIPYPLFAYSGLVVWTFFTRALSEAAQSLIMQQQLITRVYFPRILLPVAGVIAAGVDVLLTLPVLLGLVLWFGVSPASTVWALPFFLLLAAAGVLGVGLWLSALNVRYRDVRHAVPFLIQLWFLATPVMYPSSLLQGRWRLLYGINPVAGAVEGFRWALLGVIPFPGELIVTSAAVALVAIVGGLLYFHRMEVSFADVI